MTEKQLIHTRDTLHVDFFMQQGLAFYVSVCIALLLLVYLLKWCFKKTNTEQGLEEKQLRTQLFRYLFGISLGIVVVISYANMENGKQQKIDYWLHHDAVLYIQTHQVSYYVKNYKCGNTLKENDFENITNDKNRADMTLSYVDSSGQVKWLSGKIKVYLTTTDKANVTFTPITQDLTDTYSAGDYEGILYLPKDAQFSCDKEDSGNANMTATPTSSTKVSSSGVTVKIP